MQRARELVPLLEGAEDDGAIGARQALVLDGVGCGDPCRLAEALRSGEMPYVRPPEGSPEARYLQSRIEAMDGPLPSRTLPRPAARGGRGPPPPPPAE